MPLANCIALHCFGNHLFDPSALEQRKQTSIRSAWAGSTGFRAGRCVSMAYETGEETLGHRAPRFAGAKILAACTKKVLFEPPVQEEDIIPWLSQEAACYF